MKQKFMICNHCGNIIGIVEQPGAPLVCCGEEMQEMIPNSSGASVEKHMPVFEVKDNLVTVTVGEAIHPMEAGHHIAWISLQTKQGNQRKKLAVDGEPKAIFAICEGDEVEAVYEYCNLHGLWKAENK